MLRPADHFNGSSMPTTFGVLALGILLGVFVPLTTAQPNPKGVSWDSWQFLLGEWTGKGGGEPGQGAGGFSFSLDLQGQVLVRRNHAEYPATKERPAFSHDDLMVIYQEPPNLTRAVYFDNEGHIIHYTVGFAKDHKVMTFVSDLVPDTPRYRLTYTRTANDTVLVKFEIAPRGKPESFSPHIEATAYRK
jgi:hypothetical protein